MIPEDVLTARWLFAVLKVFEEVLELPHKFELISDLSYWQTDCAKTAILTCQALRGDKWGREVEVTVKAKEFGFSYDSFRMHCLVFFLDADDLDGRLKKESMIQKAVDRIRRACDNIERADRVDAAQSPTPPGVDAGENVALSWPPRPEENPFWLAK